MLDMICDKLGVQYDTPWSASDGNTYMINEYDGILIKVKTHEQWGEISGACYTDILQGRIKPVWKPEKGETYYIPEIFHEESERYNLLDWYDSEFDNWCYENNMVFKTKEEAIRRTNRMLIAYRGEI